MGRGRGELCSPSHQVRWGLVRICLEELCLPPTYCNWILGFLQWVYCFESSWGSTEQHTHRDICESKARRRPLQTSHWLDFSPAFWLFLILRAQQLLSRDFRKSLWVCTYTKCIVYLCKADGQKDFHANLKRFVLNIVKSFQKLFLKDNHFLFPF